jgi:predicted  nucleic acid-binding Zn-ribbon protein
MKKRLVLLISFAIIQLFYLPLHNRYIRADFTGPFEVTDVKVKGDISFSPRWILKQVGANRYRSLKNDTIVRDKAYAIEELYQKRGFYFATCDYTIEELEDNEFRVIYKIFEGQKVIIDEVIFDGNFFVSSKELQDIVKTKPSGFFAKNFLVEESIALDKSVIENYYHKRGIKAVVSRVEKTFNESNNVVSITFFISEKTLTGRFKNRTAKTILGQFKQIQNELQELQEEVEKHRTENQVLQEKLIDRENTVALLSQSKEETAIQLEKKIQDIEEDNKRLQEKATILEKKLQEKNEVEDMLTGYLAQERMNTKGRQEEIEKLRAEMDGKDLEKEDLEKQILQAQKDIEKERQEKDALKDKLSNFTDMIKNRIEEIDKVNTQLAVVLNETRHAIARELDSIELSTVVITGDVDEPKIIMKKEDGKKVFIQKVKKDEKDEDLMDGRVLVVNKKLNLIVINYGKEHGVKDNMLFGVFREEELVGNIRVIETRDQISAAEIVYLKEESEIREGDVVSKLES